MNTNFVNHGSDDILVKSLQEQGLVPEELSKAIDKSKLVQVEVQVQGKTGTYIRKQWKKAGDVKSTDKVIGGQKPDDNPKKSSGPVDISKFKFTNYRNPDGQNYTGRETFRGTLESVAKEIERKAQNVVNSYSGNIPPEKQLRIDFDNINRHATYRDLVEPSSEQGLKDADKAIHQRQQELIESVKDLTKWDGKKWVKDDSKKTDDTTKSWQDKVNKGNFTDEQKKELSYGVSEKHACVVEKDGKIKTAKTWDEAKYAEKQGWSNLGSLTEIVNKGELPKSESKLDSDEITDDMSTMEEISRLGLDKAIKDDGRDDTHIDEDGIRIGDKYYWFDHDTSGVLYEDKWENAKNGEEGDDVDSSVTNVNSVLKEHEKYIKSSKKSEKSEKTSGKFEVPKTKDAIQKLVASGMSKKDIMSQVKQSGITWKEHEHEGINWMRACMAMTGTTTKGGKK